MFESLTGEQTQKVENAPWDANALQYLAKGYSVIPLMPKQKGPKLPGWPTFCNELMRPESVKDFYNKNHNIGLALGPASGVCAVDIDTDDEEWLKKIKKLLPESPVKKRGAKGFTAFYKFNGLPSKSVKSDDGTAGIDFLSTGKQTVLPPSVHPMGMNYEWITKETLLSFPKGNLPELSETTLDQLLSLFRPRVKKVEEMPEVHYTDANIETVQKALSYIDPDQSYDNWIQVGLALQSQFGEKEGGEIFVNWSARGKKFDGISECLKKFHSFRDPREITIGTLFFIAKQYGYEESPDFAIEALKAKAQVFESVENTWGKPKEVDGAFVMDREQLKEIILHPVGFIAEVAEWIKKVSLFKQDLFAVAAATSFASICYAKKFMSRTFARTNNYIICVGPSGSGKSKICDNAQWLMANAPIKLRSKLMGEMASSSGLIDELVAREGAAYSYIDEIGHFFKFAKSADSNQYTKQIGAELTKLYSRAENSYTTSAYSSAAKRPVKTINFPCLVLFGQSVPGRLYDSLTTADFDDGFFNRFTIIEISDDERPVRNPDFVNPLEYFPKDIYAFWERLDVWTTNEMRKISSGNNMVGNETPLIPVYTDEAIKMLNDTLDYYSMVLPEQLGRDDMFVKGPLTRAYEQVEKYALTSCEFINDRPVVTERSVRWARAFVEFSLMSIKYRLREIADTPYARDCVNMRKSLPLNKKLTKQEFSVATKAIHINIRQKMTDDLVTQGVLQYVKDETGTYIVRRI